LGRVEGQKCWLMSSINVFSLSPRFAGRVKCGRIHRDVQRWGSQLAGFHIKEIIHERIHRLARSASKSDSGDRSMITTSLLRLIRRFCLDIRNADSVHICKSMCCDGLAIHGTVSRYNGFGGKVEHGESPAQAALRELKVCSVVLSTRVHISIKFQQRRSAVLRLHSTTAVLYFL